MALSTNPTGTLIFQKQFERNMEARWLAVGKAASTWLESSRVSVLNNEDAEETYYSEAAAAFLAWLLSEINYSILGRWVEDPLRKSYAKGASDSISLLRKLGVDTGMYVDEAAYPLMSLTIPEIGRIQSLSAPSLLSAPEHVKAMDILFGRLATELEGASAHTMQKVKDAVAVAADSGVPLSSIRHQIDEILGQGSASTKRIVRTYLVKAYQRSVIAEAKRASALSGTQVMIRWVTVRDNKVRPAHIKNHGRLMTPDQALVAMEESPWNCRCGLIVTTAQFDDLATKRKYRKERQRLTENLAA